MWSLRAINNHGIRGEWVDESISIYLDDEYRGQFVPSGASYKYTPTTMASLDIRALNRIRGALEIANKLLFREVNSCR